MMKHRFVLDVNIIWRAQTLEDETGEYTADYLYLVTQVIRTCHVIVVSHELHKHYLRVAATLMREGVPQGPSVLRLLQGAMAIPGKYEWTRSPETVKGEDKIPEDDRPLVRLAVTARANLVTADGRLRDAVKKTAILTKVKTDICDLQRALELVESPEW